MIETKCSHAALIVIGLPVSQAAFLEFYERIEVPTEEALGDLLGRELDDEHRGQVLDTWPNVLGEDSNQLSVWEIFEDVPSHPGFWVWEGKIWWTEGLTPEGANEGSEPVLEGAWRRASTDEVLSYDSGTRSTYDNLV